LDYLLLEKLNWWNYLSPWKSQFYNCNFHQSNMDMEMWIAFIGMGKK
jgi:hypothetical protein